MTTAEFTSKYQGHEYMTREIAVTLIETNDGYLMARAESRGQVAYAASRNSEQATGAATMAASYGEFDCCGIARETPEAAIEMARTLNSYGI